LSYPELPQIFSILSPEIRDQSQEIFYQISRFVAVGGWQVCTSAPEIFCLHTSAPEICSCTPEISSKNAILCSLAYKTRNSFEKCNYIIALWQESNLRICDTVLPSVDFIPDQASKSGLSDPDCDLWIKDTVLID
jgi:hypothetical protein